MGLVRTLWLIGGRLTGISAQITALTDAVSAQGEVLDRIRAAQKRQAADLGGLIERTNYMARQQDELNQLAQEQAAQVARIGESLTGIQGDMDEALQRLRDAEANNQPLDFGPLEAVRNQLASVAEQAASVDAQYPPPAPVEPSPGADEF